MLTRLRLSVPQVFFIRVGNSVGAVRGVVMETSVPNAICCQKYRTSLSCHTILAL